MDIEIKYRNCCHTCSKSIIIAANLGGCGCNIPKVPCHDNTSNSPCVECEDPCDDVIPTDCIVYSAGDIPQLGIKNGDQATKIIILLATELLDLKRRIVLLEA